MKNKKLFAILTLVCFMFTLMPVAAFAADVTPAYGYIDEEYISVEAGDNVVVKATQSGNYYVYATKDGSLFNKMTGTNVTGSAIGLSVAKITAGTETTVQFPVAGEYKIGVAKAESALAAVVEGTALVAPATVLGNLQTFAIGMINNTVTVEADDDATYDVTLSAASGTIDADNGFSSLLVTATVVENLAGGNTKAVYGQDVKITTDSHAVTVTKLDQATKVNGTQRFTIAATIPGTYHVYVAYGDDKETYTVTVDPASAVDISVLAQPTAPVDENTDAADTGIVFAIKDASGYAYTANLTVNQDYKVATIAAPVGFDKTTALKLTYVSTEGGWVIVKADDSDLPLAKEGEYTFKVSLKNGATATASVKVQEFDEAVAIKFVKAPAAVVLNGSVDIAESKVYAVDANGVTKPAAGLDTLTLSANGAAISTFTYDSANSKYVLTVKDAEKYVGTTVTIIAVLGTGTDALTTTTEIIVTEEAATVVYASNEAAVGKTVKLVGSIVDENGKAVTLTSATPQVIVLDQPEDAVVYVNPTFNAGKVYVDFLANTAGEYKIQTIVKYGTNKYISGIETITVDGAHGAYSDVIVMSIGAKQMVKNSEIIAMPAAPEIVDSRTMVPARAGLEAFGAVVVWDEATQTVTAEMNGVKVVMTIGEKVYTVNGKAVVGDAAPYITAASTMVPVSFFTNAFGIVATPIYDANGVCDVLFTK